MLGSPNHAKLVYDGDFSNSPPPATAPDVNPGAALIEQAFIKYLSDRGMATEPTGFDGRSDYKAFQDNGVPAGGLFTGAEVPKTEAQAAKWGGIPGRPFDPNYHQAGDTIDNVDFAAYEQMADAAAYVTGLYATQALPANSGGGAKAPSAAKMQRQVAQSERLGEKLQR
jgi:Zn-dependent M28 family amino/carboxypeptidase